MLNATPLMRTYARYRLGRLRAQDPAATQERQLLGLLAKAKETRFGREHNFSDIKSVADFQTRVRLRKYEDFWDEYWKAAFPALSDITWPATIPFFAVTSGTTTGVTKYIPCSHEMNRSNEWAGAEIFVHHLANRPQSRLLGGRNFMLGGSTELKELAPGVHQGDLSGIAAKVMPLWARLRYFPPQELENIPDWEEKIERLARRSLEEDIRAISDTPSWLLLFFDKLAELRPGSGRKLVNLYPNLELVIHGGVNFAPYRKAFAEWLEGSRAETREVYSASEGFVAVADRGDGEGLRLILDTGLFYEFVPVEELDQENPTRHWLANAETGVNYALAMSTCAGLWAYIVGDTVELIGRDPPRVLITGRTAYTLSAFGEHLIDQEIEEAVSAAAQELGAKVTDYSVGPVFPEKGGEVGAHLYVVEFAEAVPEPARIEKFARALDANLCETNEDYRTYRAGDRRLKPPRVHALDPGTFARWMKRRGRLGGQNKVPRIVNDPDLFADLREFTGCA